MRILIGVPSFDNSISSETHESLWAPKPYGHELDLVRVKGYACDRARNEIANRARDFDAVLMVDGDIVIPPDALWHMTNPIGDIVLAPYIRKRTKRGKSEIFRAGTLDYTDENNIPMRELKKVCGRIPIKGGGLGCALIRSEVFSRLDYPWFRFEDDGVRRLSEDFYFCSKAARAGFDIQAECRVICGHVWSEVHYG